MDFHFAQDKAKNNTIGFVGLFLTAFIITPIFVGVCVMIAAASIGWIEFHGVDSFINFFLDYTIYAMAPMYVIMAIATIWNYYLFRRGGDKVALSLGGVPINEAELNEVDKIKTVNVIEEIALAAGVKKPEIFIIPTPEINAFAAGKNKDKSVVGLTKGAVEKLNRAELQAVVAHEYGHIVNEDMKINARIGGMLGGLFFIFYMGWKLFKSGFYSEREGKNHFVIGATIMGAGILAWMVGRVIQAAVSRQREYLADAVSVQYTREPDAMASALRKIAIDNRERAEAMKGKKKTWTQVKNFVKGKEKCAHMFFFGVSDVYFMKKTLATHPPIEKRLGAILGKEVDLEKFLSEKQAENEEVEIDQKEAVNEPDENGVDEPTVEEETTR